MNHTNVIKNSSSVIVYLKVRGVFPGLPIHPHYGVGKEFRETLT